MVNCVLRKGLVLGVIVLFIGIAVIPSTGSNIAVDESSKSITKAPMDSLLPPLMWTEDFSTLYIKIPGDPGGGIVYYCIDWGDGNVEELGPYDSDETATLSHMWDEGLYTIKVKAKNQYGEESKWATYGLLLSSDFKSFHISIGYVGITYIFTIYWKDCVYYYINWGDGSSSGWIGPYPEEIVIIAHKWDSPGEYMLSLRGKDIYGNESDWFTLIITILSLENNPPDAPEIDGLTIGQIEWPYAYKFSSTDPDGDDIAEYIVNWGDEVGNERIKGPFPSGEIVIEFHWWYKRGFFTITACAKDIHGLKGPDGTFVVLMPRNRIITNTFQTRLFERFPNAFPILRQLLVI